MDKNDHSRRSLSVVIVTWNGLHLLKESLDSVVEASRQFHGQSEIIVVDNGSQDRTVDVILDFYPQIQMLALERNFGFSVGNNRGVEKARYDHILFLNNDVKVAPDFFNSLWDEWDRCDGNPFSLSPQTNHWDGRQLTDKVFCTSISVDLSDGDFVQSWAVSNLKSLVSSGLHRTIYNTGAALMVDRKKYEALGGFHPLFSPAYWEDVDLCYQAWKREWPSYVTTKIHIWHKISASSGQLKSDFKERLMTRNFFLFYLLNVNDSEYRAAFERNMSDFLSRHRMSEIGKDIANFLEENQKLITELRESRQKAAKLSDREVLESVAVPKESFDSPRFFQS
jgi:GT2 family glycosyltransferase